MKSKIKWKYLKRVNCHEGFIDGKLAFSIEGTLCVTDLRKNRSSQEWVSPDYYRITDVENGKQIANDLLNGENSENHEANRQAWIAEQEKTSRLIKDVDKLIEQLKNL